MFHRPNQTGLMTVDTYPQPQDNAHGEDVYTLLLRSPYISLSSVNYSDPPQSRLATRPLPEDDVIFLLEMYCKYVDYFQSQCWGTHSIAVASRSHSYLNSQQLRLSPSSSSRRVHQDPSRNIKHEYSPWFTRFREHITARRAHLFH